MNIIYAGYVALEATHNIIIKENESSNEEKKNKDSYDLPMK